MDDDNLHPQSHREVKMMMLSLLQLLINYEYHVPKPYHITYNEINNIYTCLRLVCGCSPSSRLGDIMSYSSLPTIKVLMIGFIIMIII